MLLDLAERFDGDAAEFAHASEIVAKQIDDHRIFGSVLFAVQ
jgi:hypothetical protein